MIFKTTITFAIRTNNMMKYPLKKLSIKKLIIDL